MPTRRQVIGSGVVAVAALGVGGLIYESRRNSAPADAFAFRVLDEEDRAILAAIVPAMIPTANVAATRTNARTASRRMGVDVRRFVPTSCSCAGR